MTQRNCILVAVDYSGCAERALDEALRVCSERSAELHVITVGEASSALASTRPPEEVDQTARAAFQREALDNLLAYVQQRAEAVGAPAPDKLEAHFSFDDPAHAIAEVASRLQVGLIVVGHRGRGAVKRLLLGSVARTLLEEVQTPVLVVP